ncbi:MAG: hypothetical protein HY329_25595 [Chloroflexi bacterium]|nr:hypothetical protein [Chloroflexota bacterium]
MFDLLPRGRGHLVVAALLVVVIGTQLALPLRTQAALSSQTAVPTREQLIWTAERYARNYVQKREDPTYGYTLEFGYPLYLYFLGEMYRDLHRVTGQPLYRERFLRAARFVQARASGGLTWHQYVGYGLFLEQPDPLYNALFSELLLDAWVDTQDDSFLDSARGAVRALPVLYGPNRRLATVPQDYAFITYAAIAAYVNRTGDGDAELVALGERLYRHAASLYDPATGRWFFKVDEKELNRFDTHAAYYELVTAFTFMRQADHVRAVYPRLYDEQRARLRPMMRVVTSHMLTSGTFNYATFVPDYTESAGQTIWALELYERAFGPEYRWLADNAKKTLINRQLPDGSYQAAPNNKDVSLMYSDAVGWGIAGWAAGDYPKLDPITYMTLLPAVGKSYRPAGR